MSNTLTHWEAVARVPTQITENAKRNVQGRSVGTLCVAFIVGAGDSDIRVLATQLSAKPSDRRVTKQANQPTSANHSVISLSTASVFGKQAAGHQRMAIDNPWRTWASVIYKLPWALYRCTFAVMHN